jgi:hypothetical protein
MRIGGNADHHCCLVVIFRTAAGLLRPTLAWLIVTVVERGNLSSLIIAQPLAVSLLSGDSRRVYVQYLSFSSLSEGDTFSYV